MFFLLRSDLIVSDEQSESSGGIGQPLALLLKANQLVTEACSVHFV